MHSNQKPVKSNGHLHMFSQDSKSTIDSLNTPKNANLNFQEYSQMSELTLPFNPNAVSSQTCLRQEDEAESEQKRLEILQKEKIEAKKRYSLEMERQAKIAQEIRQKKEEAQR